MSTNEKHEKFELFYQEHVQKHTRQLQDLLEFTKRRAFEDVQRDYSSLISETEEHLQKLEQSSVRLVSELKRLTHH